MGKYDLRFDMVSSMSEIAQLKDFLLDHTGHYDPNTYEPWVEGVCIPDVQSGRRRSLAWWQEGQMIGDAILKSIEPNTALLRHFRVVAPNFPHRGLGAFMLRQVFPEAVELLAEEGNITYDANQITIQLDTKPGSVAESFFTRFGFDVVDYADLYHSGHQEVIM